MSFESGLVFLIAIIIFSVTPGPGVFALLVKPRPYVILIKKSFAC